MLLVIGSRRRSEPRSWPPQRRSRTRCVHCGCPCIYRHGRRYLRCRRELAEARCEDDGGACRTRSVVHFVCCWSDTPAHHTQRANQLDQPADTLLIGRPLMASELQRWNARPHLAVILKISMSLSFSKTSYHFLLFLRGVVFLFPQKFIEKRAMYTYNIGLVDGPLPNWTKDISGRKKVPKHTNNYLNPP